MITFLLQLAVVQYGLASVYNDKTYACPKSSYQYTHLPTAAHRSLPCGSIINVKIIDSDKEVKAVIADRGPYGACKPSKISSRACGFGSKWINGRDFVKKKLPMNSATWRGILDMSMPLAKRLGVKNRLVPVVIYTDLANSAPSNVIEDAVDDPKLERNHSNFNRLTFLGSIKRYDGIEITSGESFD